MNATWTLGLYPARWRRQYDATFRPTLKTTSVGIGDTLDLVLGAAHAHPRPDSNWPQHGPLPAAASEQKHDPRQSPWWNVLLFGHIGLFLIVNTILIAINFLTSSDFPWFLYPLWGWGIALAAHIGITWSRKHWLPAHALTSVTILVGLVVMNIVHYWPVGVWAVGVLVVVPLTVDLLQIVSNEQSRQPGPECR